MSDLQTAERKQAKCAADLESETAKLLAAQAAFMSDGTDRSLDAQVRATAKVERAKKLLADATAATDDVRRAIEAADLARAREQHASDLVSLPRFPDSLASLHDRLIELDRQAFDLLAQYDIAVEAGAAAWDRATATAVHVGSHLGAIQRPTLDDAILAAQIVATSAREKDARSSCADMFDAEPGHGDWRLASATAAEREAYLRQEKENQARALRQEGAAQLLAIAKRSADAAKETP